MIAEFPTFSPLQIGDREGVQRLTAPYAPYSDFNFTSLYSWDTREAVRVSVLNENLVVRFTDYTTNEPFYSFIGDRAVDDTTTRLFDLARSEGLAEELRLVPEVAAWRASPGEIAAQEDSDNFDYILSIDRLKSYQGNKLGPKRNFVNRFNREYEAHAVVVDLSNVAIQTRFLDMFHRWMLQKGERADNAENELMALHRAMFAARFIPDLFTVATFVEGDLAGFSINEVLKGGYGMIHFEKADASYVGVYAHLMQRMAWLMSERGCHSINYEQDLGVFGLRKGKRSYVPQTYLRKYALVPRSARERAPGSRGPEELSTYFLLTADHAALGDQVTLRPPPMPPEVLRLASIEDGGVPGSIGVGPRTLAPMLPPAPGDAFELPPLSRARPDREPPGKSGEWLSVRPSAPPPRATASVKQRSLAMAPPPMDLSFEGGDRGPLTQRSPDSMPRALRRISRAPLPREDEPEEPEARVPVARESGARRVG